MATLNPNSPEILREEILAAAALECERTLRLARQTSDSYLARARAEAEKIRSEILEAARAEAARRSELILATVPVESGRMRAERIETLLETIRESAHRQLESSAVDRHETVVALAVEAIRRMQGGDFVLRLSPEDHAAFGEALAGEISRDVGRSPLKVALVADSTVTCRGVTVQDADGHQFWDNRLPSRLKRLWPELRRQIAVQTGLGEKKV